MGGRGGGQGVSGLAFYSDNQSLNPVEVDKNFTVKLFSKRTKLNKRGEVWAIFAMF